MPIKILFTHETSGACRNAWRKLGFDAYSCDLLPSEDGSPYHWQGDALAAIQSDYWDMIGMHPSCQFLTVAGIHWNKRGRGEEGTTLALQHVKDCIRAAMQHTPRWYLENPVSIISSQIREPDQIIQPYQFGEDASKATCLWLKGLSLLRPSGRFNGRWVLDKGRYVERWGNQTDSGQNKLAPSADRWKDRSRTYPGIANAMADQWSKLL